MIVIAGNKSYNKQYAINTMKTIFFSLIFCSAALSLQAQTKELPRKDVANVDVGWKQIVEFKEPPQPYSFEERRYTAKQIGYVRAFITWMQQTFTPKGMLGESKYYTIASSKSEPVTSRYYDYNEAQKNNRKALPNPYGAFSRFYLFLKKDEKGKYVPSANYNVQWNIEANAIENISNQIIHLSTPQECYFTMPRYEVGMKGTLDKSWNEEAAKLLNFNNHPNLKKYDHYYIPPKILNDGQTMERYVVIMTKDNQPLPFEQVTVGEFISQLERQLPMMYKMTINGGSKDINLMERAKRGLQIFKNKFGKQANEKVYLSESLQLNLFNFTDVDESSEFNWFSTVAKFEVRRSPFTYFPLMKVKKGVREACAAGDPQWLVITWMAPFSKDLAGDIHYMESILNRFNYDYVYNYFFGDKRPTEPYKPLSYNSK